MGGSAAKSMARKRRIATRSFCAYCDEPDDLCNLTIDHKTPRSRGGSDADWNLALACSRCNTMKGNLTLEEFLSVRHDGRARKLLQAAVIAEIRPEQVPHRLRVAGSPLAPLYVDTTRRADRLPVEHRPGIVDAHPVIM